LKYIAPLKDEERGRRYLRPYNIVQQDDLIGVTLGNYKILGPLGQGGMARVYKAHQENLDREV